MRFFKRNREDHSLLCFYILSSYRVVWYIFLALLYLERETSARPKWKCIGLFLIQPKNFWSGLRLEADSGCMLFSGCWGQVAGWYWEAGQHEHYSRGWHEDGAHGHSSHGWITRYQRCRWASLRVGEDFPFPGVCGADSREISEQDEWRHTATLDPASESQPQQGPYTPFILSRFMCFDSSFLRAINDHKEVLLE